MPFEIVRNDITKMQVDAVVNAANTALQMGGGVCGALFYAAGAEKLQEECNKIGGCNVGEAVITSGCGLPARYIIHTPGPIWRGGNQGEERLLHDCYLNSLKLALRHKCRSIAFPLISSGIYGYPKEQALRVAISAIGEFLMNNDIMVYLVVYDKKSFVLSEKLFTEIERFIDDNYVEERSLSECSRVIEPYEFRQVKAVQEAQEPLFSYMQPVKSSKRSLDDIVNHLDESFTAMLLRLIDEKGLTDTQTYKRANIDRKLFSKMRSKKGYNPSKATALALAIALELNLDETCDLLGKAGYALSHSNKFDVIIEYFITEGNYNIYEINEALFAFDQALLGA